MNMAWLILFSGLIVRLVPIITEQVLFHFDSARDWLWVRDLVMSRNLTLIGPWSSLQGVFYGPLTYYLLAVFFWAFGGNPIGGSVYALVVNLLALIILCKFLRQIFGYRISIIGSWLLTFSSLSLYVSTFIFQTNLSLLLGALVLWPIWQLSRKKFKALPWLGLLIGLGIETNFFWTVFLLPCLLFWGWRLKVSRKTWLITGLVLLIPLRSVYD